MQKQIYSITILTGFFLLSFVNTLAQEYKVVNVGLPEKGIKTQSVLDSSSLTIYTRTVIHQLRKSGYWLANLDSISFMQDSATLYFYMGRRFSSIEVSMSVKAQESYISGKYQFKKETDVDKVNQLMDEIIKDYENNGYPFASVQIDSAYNHMDNLNIYLYLDPGIKITYDSIIISPDGILKRKFLSRFLDLEYNQVYNHKKVEDIPEKLSLIPSVSLLEVQNTFAVNRSKIALELKSLKVNYFDAILGLIPSSERSGEAELTGELNLSIKNLFQSAKQFTFHWERYTVNSQALQSSYLHPMFLGMPLDLFLSYDQLRQDTLFSNRSLTAALDYYPSSYTRIRFNYENKLGNELNDDNQLSGDFNLDYYGFEGQLTQLDNRQKPRNGFDFILDAKIGAKEIDNDTLGLRNISQYLFSTNLKYYKKIKRRSVLYLSSTFGWLSSEQLFLNDLFRLGGLWSIRGFNENEFFADRFIYGNLEWRYYLEENSYMLFFYDQGFLSYNLQDKGYFDNPSGLGVGVQFQTNAGNLILIYGLGRREGQNFSFDTSKIHFGYNVLF